MLAKRLRPFARIAALLLAGTASAGQAGDRVRSIPVASIAAPPDGRNVTDAKPPALDVGRPKVADRGDVNVTVDRAKVIRLPERTQTVVIGNPAVADIAIQKSGIVVLTGKSFGVTNFLALDASGGLLGESMVSVTAPNDSTIMVQRGLERQTYSCTPVCQPSVALGDASGYFNETKGQADAHGAFLTAR